MAGRATAVRLHRINKLLAISTARACQSAKVAIARILLAGAVCCHPPLSRFASRRAARIYRSQRTLSDPLRANSNSSACVCAGGRFGRAHAGAQRVWQPHDRRRDGGHWTGTCSPCDRQARRIHPISRGLVPSFGKGASPPHLHLTVCSQQVETSSESQW